MLVKYSIDTLESGNTSHSVTLVPRLGYSVNLLCNIVEILEEQKIELNNLNHYLITDFDELNPSHVKTIKLDFLSS